MLLIRDMAGTGREIRCRTAVVKLGSNVVMGPEGAPDRGVIEGLADSIAGLRERGARVIVVTSGAVALGRGRLGRPRPKTIPEKQAMAAIGQIGLMHLYQDVLGSRGLQAAQVLLTRADMEDRRRYLNLRNAMERLLDLGAVPVINENDTLSTDELSFGDNDVLSAYVAVKLKADLLVLLSTVPGVLTAPPGKGEPEIVPVIERFDASETGGVDDSQSGHGSGGMVSKLEAARAATSAGIHAVIAGGKVPGILTRVASGSFPGTYIPAGRRRSMSALERWIGFGRSVRGRRLIVDAGAAEALTRRQASLLPAGVTAVEGDFGPGDVVEVVDPAGSVIARGLVNYSADEVRRIRGRKSSEIEAILGGRRYDEIIHRDHLVGLNREA